MPLALGVPLSRRERQIMEIIYRQGQATANEVLEALPDPPSYSSVRTILRILEEKGHLTHTQEGARYLYLPTQPRHNVALSALRQALHTFYEGSLEQAVSALLSSEDSQLSQEELERLGRLIEEAKERRATP